MGTLEVWKDIPWYDGLYQGSTFWNIRWMERKCISKFGSIRKVPWKIIKQSIVKWYLVLDLSKLWIRLRFRSSRLLAGAFHWLDINDKSIFVCHKDDDPLNNRVDNLFLWTHKDNMRDMVKKWRAKWRGKLPILQFSKDWKFIREWGCSDDVYEELKINKSQIWACCRWDKHCKTSWWFIWKYSV